MFEKDEEMTDEQIEKKAEEYIKRCENRILNDLDLVKFAEQENEELEETINKLREQLALRYSLEDKIKELEQENAELRNNGFTVSAMTEQQLKVAIEKGEQLEKENAELKAQIEQAKEYLEQTLPYLENIDEESDELYDKINEFIKEIEK